MARATLVPKLPTTVSGFDDASNRVPMPDASAGINHIMDVSAASAKEMIQTLAARPGLNLGNVLGGNNQTIPPPTQRANAINAAALAGLAGASVAAMAGGSANSRQKAPAAAKGNPAPSAKPSPAATQKKPTAQAKSGMVTDASLDQKAVETSGDLLKPLSGPNYAAPKPAKAAPVKPQTPPATAASKPRPLLWIPLGDTPSTPATNPTPVVAASPPLTNCNPDIASCPTA